MRSVQRAVQEISQLKLDIQSDAFQNVSIDKDSHLKFIRDVGRIQGLDEALKILLNIIRGDEDV